MFTNKYLLLLGRSVFLLGLLAAVIALCFFEQHVVQPESFILFFGRQRGERVSCVGEKKVSD